MPISLNKIRILLLLAFFFCAFIPFFSDSKIETSLLSLLNDDNTPFEKLLGKNANSIQIIFESSSKKHAMKTAEEFFKKIEPGNFANIRFKVTDEERKKLIDTFITHRSGLLSFDDQKLLEHNDFLRIQENAYRRITTDIIPSIVPFNADPFFLLSDYINDMLSAQGNWKISNGFIWAGQKSKYYVLMTLTIKSFRPDVVCNLQKTANELTQRTADTKIFLSGAPVHAAIEMQKSIIQINCFSVISIIFSIILLYLLLHKLWYVIPVLINMVVAFFIGYCGLLFFPKVHIITFIFATSLIGLSIDYSLHFLSTPESLRKDLIKSMFKAYMTTCVCFLPLFFSELYLLKQIAVFTVLGLSVVFINTVVFYPLFSPSESLKEIRLQKLSKKFYIIALMLIVTGFNKATFYTNVTDLYNPDNTTFEADKLFLDLSGKKNSKFLLISADNLENAIQKEEEVKKHIAFLGVSSIVPSIKQQQANKRKIKQLFSSQAAKFMSKLNVKQQIKFDETPFLLPKDVKELTDMFIINENQKVYLLIPIKEELTLPENAAKLHGVSIFEPKKILEEKLNQYEASVYNSLIISAILMLILIFIFYRKMFINVITPSLLSVLCVLSILSLTNTSIHLFHLLGCFIVIGVGIDYTIFNIAGFVNKAVVFSFLSTLVGLGMLFFSTFPVLSSMGFVFGLGLLFSFLLSLCLDRKRSLKWRTREKEIAQS